MRRGLLVALGAIALGGCAAAGARAHVEVHPQLLRLPDMYRGSLEIEGDRVPSMLQIHQAGAALTSRLTASDLGMAADGVGTLDGSQVELTMAYGAACAGTARLVGRISEPTFLYTGRIIASDCTGDVEGSFSFTPERSR
ncbi:MAG: hypothetical protein ACC667_09560 [Longimicrobiales bacterium]